MAKQALVIGLGQFGMSLARAMAERRVEILAVDCRSSVIQTASTFAAEALCFDATSNEALARVSPAKRDICICAIGDDSRESSIICTALLRQMGARRVIARANDDIQARILTLVGAHEVVNPEREFGERFANKLAYEPIRADMPLGEDLVITELSPPAAFVGRSLADLELPRRYGVTVVAIRRQGEGTVTIPTASQVLRENDTLLTVSRPEKVQRLIERM